MGANPCISKCGLVFAAIGMMLALSHPAGGVSTRVRQILGKETVSIISRADRVEVFRFEPFSAQMMRKRRKEPDPGYPQLYGYAVIAAGKPQGRDFARSLAAAVLNDQTYAGGRKACAFDPGVGFRVWDRKREALVVLCFNCDMILLDKSVRNPQRKPVIGDFLNRPVFVQMAKQALPDDPEIQALAETR